MPKKVTPKQKKQTKRKTATKKKGAAVSVDKVPQSAAVVKLKGDDKRRADWQRNQAEIQSAFIKLLKKLKRKLKSS